MQPHFDIARVRRDFDRVADIYEQHATLQRDVARELCRRVGEYGLPEGLRLDLGSGTGYVAQELKKQKPENRTLQLDIALNMCRASLRWDITINANMEALPLQSESMAAIYSSLALQWVNHPEKVFTESCRTLRKGGILAFATFGPQSLSELRSLFGGVNTFVPRRQLEDMLQKAGFASIESDAVLYTRHYASVQDLLRSIKRVGARGKYVDYISTFPGKHAFQRMDEIYRSRHGSSQSVPATWEVFFLIGRK